MKRHEQRGHVEYTRIKYLLSILAEYQKSGGISNSHRYALRQKGIEPESLSLASIAEHLGYSVNLMLQKVKYDLDMTQNKKGTQHHDEDIVLKTDRGGIPHGRLPRGMLQTIALRGKNRIR